MGIDGIKTEIGFLSDFVTAASVAQHLPGVSPKYVRANYEQFGGLKRGRRFFFPRNWKEGPNNNGGVSKRNEAREALQVSKTGQRQAASKSAHLPNKARRSGSRGKSRNHVSRNGQNAHDAAYWREKLRNRS